MPHIVAQDLTFDYPSRRALDHVSFTVDEKRIFGLLGPNGGGKTTLFRILCTLALPSSGRAEICGRDVAREPFLVRRDIGVVFQGDSVDGELSVFENLRLQGRLYGLRGSHLQTTVVEMAERFGLRDRGHDLAKNLSGGLRRRLEIAKSIVHSPRVLLLDEPSAGLDPNARYDLWNLLRAMRAERGMTILLTTHLMEEADRCDTLAIMDRGRIISSGAPDVLKDRIGGDVITMKATDPQSLSTRIEQRFEGKPMVVDGAVRLETKRGHVLVPQIIEAFPGLVEAITVSRPTLEDVFVHETGHRFSTDPVVEEAILGKNR